ncbi:MAG: hypothetical protein ABJA34_00820 [Pseudonocardiales bacterium]
MTHDALVTDYIASLARSGWRASDLIDAVRDHITIDTTYAARTLSRPGLLSHAEVTQLTEDLDHLHAALTGLPDRLFGGDMAAFARAVGATEAQALACVRGRSAAPPRMGRADLLLDDVGFRLMEVNWTSAVGGLDTAGLNRRLLELPFFAEFAERQGLTFIDPMVELVDTLFTECKVPTGTRPVVGLVDWPASFETLEPQLRKSAEWLGAFGMDAYPCHVGQLRYADGRVWLEDLAIDVVYRLFLMEDLLDDSGPALIEPVLRAAERGEVALFTAMDSELYGSKAALALLSDEAMRQHLAPRELACIDRILPWTRMVRYGPVTVAGKRVELTEYAADQQPELILKPTLFHGGMGVVQGWKTTREDWRQRIEAAVDQPFVLQRRIHATPEPFPTDTGIEKITLAWGAFMVSRGYGGMLVRGSPDADSLLSVNLGATATCCFHQTRPT